VGDLSRRAADLPRDRWAVAPLPGPAGPANGVVAANCLAVSATARDPARAWALVDYLCRSATQRRFHRITGDLPSRPSAWRTAGLAGDPASEVFHAQIERATPQPNVPEWQRIVDEVQLVAERMVRGDLGVDAAAAEMDRRADALLAKRRWLLDRGRIA
jgi:multiple sugar transport system substrate-binding protein